MKLTPLPQPLQKECTKAARIFERFVTSSGDGLDEVVPRSVLRQAKGFVIFTVVKAGLLISARAGSGLVIARLPDGTFSAPSAIGTAGIGIGTQWGAELTEFLIVLNSTSAVESFMSAGSWAVGGNASIAVGPLGRNGEARASLNTKGRMVSMLSYSRTKGLFSGVSLESTVIASRDDANAIAYQKDVTAKQLLNGDVPPPEWADILIQTISQAIGIPTWDDDGSISSGWLSISSTLDERSPTATEDPGQRAYQNSRSLENGLEADTGYVAIGARSSDSAPRRTQFSSRSNSAPDALLPELASRINGGHDGDRWQNRPDLGKLQTWGSTAHAVHPNHRSDPPEPDLILHPNNKLSYHRPSLSRKAQVCSSDLQSTPQKHRNDRTPSQEMLDVVSGSVPDFAKSHTQATPTMVGSVASIGERPEILPPTHPAPPVPSLSPSAGWEPPSQGRSDGASLRISHKCEGDNDLSKTATFAYGRGETRKVPAKEMSYDSPPEMVKATVRYEYLAAQDGDFSLPG